MPAPPNTTAGTAVAISALPYSVSQAVDDAGTTYTVWYSYLATTDALVSVFGYGGGTSYTPRTQIYSDAGVTQIVDTGTSYADRPTQFQATSGTTYYFKFTPPAGNPSPADLALVVELGPNATVPSGSIAVNDDTQGFPIVFLSSTNADDNNVLKGMTFAPAGEAGDVLPGGVSLWSNAWDGNLEVMDTDFTSIATVAINIGFGIAIRASPGQNLFYVGHDLNPVVVKTVDATGAIGGTTWTLTGNNSIKGLASNEAGTILYFAIGGTAVAIKRWDLSLNVAMADLVAGIANYDVGDIIVLSDDTILVAYYDVGTDFKVLHYDTAGAVLNTYNFGNVAMPASTFSRIAYAADNPNSFWVWTHSSPSTSTFANIKVSDGSTLASVDYTEYETGVYQGAATATPTSEFGISFSCPFIITRASLGPTCVAVAISVQPVSTTISAGGLVTMSVTATGTAPITYQWYEGASGVTTAPITGATSSSYTTPALAATTTYWVRVSNTCSGGSTADSTTTTITVEEPSPADASTEEYRIRWVRRSPTVFSDGKRVFHRRFQVDFQPGVGLAVADGEQDHDPIVLTRTSDDGGATWSNWREMSLGARGNYLKTMRLFQLGAAFNRVYEISGDSPTPLCIVQAWLDIEGGKT